MYVSYLFKNLLSSLKKVEARLGLIGDYVVESGTSENDGWRYQKWESGKAECWTRKQITITAWNAWGILYEASPTMPQFDFPANLFVVAPRLLVSASGDMGLAGVEPFHLTSATQTTQIYALRPNAAGTGGVVTFEYYAIGRWK